MKIGIITFHQALNYGAVLQTYALQQTIKNKGVDCEIIDYCCDQIAFCYDPVGLKKCKGKKDVLRCFPYYMRMNGRRKKFAPFIQKFLKLSVPYDKETIGDIEKAYDAIITGSDQVFNDKCTNFDNTYFLDFITDSKKKNSYAASFGFQEVPEELVTSYKALLQDFNRISVREQEGINIVHKLIQKEAKRHVDPTLLLSGEEWKKLVSGRKPKGKYIFVYTVQGPVHAIDYAKKLRDKTGYPIYYLHGTIQLRNIRHEKDDINHLYTSAPDEFVELIEGAEYVITNSFHGTVFSILFQKKFMVELETTWTFNHRSKELLELLGLESHVMKEINLDSIEVDSDWNYISDYLAQEKKKANEYLEEILCE